MASTLGGALVLAGVDQYGEFNGYTAVAWRVGDVPCAADNTAAPADRPGLRGISLLTSAVRVAHRVVVRTPLVSRSLPLPLLPGLRLLPFLFRPLGGLLSC